jgi:predicted amidohydrolase
MGATLRVNLIQPDLAWEQPELNLKRVGDMLAASAPADLVVLPEMWSTGFVMEPQRWAAVNKEVALPAMQAWANQMGAAVTGTLVWEETGKYYNRLWWVVPGEAPQWYDKRHLFGLAGEDARYTPGESRKVFEYRSWRIFPQVCYDLRFPAWSRNTPEVNYDVAIYPAHWPDKRIFAWNGLLPARAIENMAYVIGVNRAGVDGHGQSHSGQSCAFDCLGQPLMVPLVGEGWHQVMLHKKALEETRARMGFLADADLISFPQIFPSEKSSDIG